MNDTKGSLPGAGKAKPSAWPWLWIGLGLAVIALAYIGGQDRHFLSETVTGGLSIAGLVLLFGGLGARGGRGGG